MRGRGRKRALDDRRKKEKKKNKESKALKKYLSSFSVPHHRCAYDKRDEEHLSKNYLNILFIFKYLVLK